MERKKCSRGHGEPTLGLACLFRNDIKVPWMEEKKRKEEKRKEKKRKEEKASRKSLTLSSSTRSEKTDIVFDEAFGKVQ